MPSEKTLYRRIWLLAIFDIALVNAIILGLSVFKFEGNIPEHNLIAYKITWMPLNIGFLFLFWLQGLYDLSDEDDGVSIAFKTLLSVSVGVIVLMAVSFFGRAFSFPRSVLLASWPILAALFALWRIRLHVWTLSRFPVRRVVFLGPDERGQMLQRFIAEQPGKRFEFVRQCKGGAGLKEEIQSANANTLVISANLEEAYTTARNLYLELPHLEIFLIPGIYEIIIGARHHRSIGDIPLVALTRHPIQDRHLAMKRFFDVTVSLLIGAAFSPFMILIAAAIKLTSKGPVIYRQERVGKNGRLFRVMKFRTMIQGAEKETGPTLATENDPRITPVGRILRKTRLDELPQLLNILKGNMSLVGPRPERPFFVEKFEKEVTGFAERKQVLPGLTGLAQVSGRYDTDPENKIKYDLLYIYNYTPPMDVSILYRTAQHLIREWL